MVGMGGGATAYGSMGQPSALPPAEASCRTRSSVRLWQGWELTRLVHELFQQGRELSRESVQLNSGSRAQDRFNKVQLNKDPMIREPH